MPLFPAPPRTPTSQTFLSGSGTYTTPAGVRYIVVEMVGGGAGGNGSASTAVEDAGIGTNGANTTFGTTLLVAGGGQAPLSNTNEVGGAGGTASLGSGPFGLAIPGASGGGTASAGNVPTAASPFLAGADGGDSPVFNGGGRGGYGNDPNNTGAGPGQAGTVNTGGGGGGGGMQNHNNIVGAAGGSSGYVRGTITSPAATYPYSVGAGGLAGAAGTNGVPGGAGGSGMIIVWEF